MRWLDALRVSVTPDVLAKLGARIASVTRRTA